MTLYAVTREAGPTWTEGEGAFTQPGVQDHTAYMNQLSDDGFLLLAGPLAGTEQGRIRVLLVADAASPAEVAQRLADDPWERAQRVVTTKVEPWNLLVGEARLSTQAVSR
jgi:uncharacterized protein YciI